MKSTGHDWHSIRKYIRMPPSALYINVMIYYLTVLCKYTANQLRCASVHTAPTWLASLPLLRSKALRKEKSDFLRCPNCGSIDVASAQLRAAAEKNSAQLLLFLILVEHSYYACSTYSSLCSTSSPLLLYLYPSLLSMTSLLSTVQMRAESTITSVLSFLHIPSPFTAIHNVVHQVRTFQYKRAVFRLIYTLFSFLFYVYWSIADFVDKYMIRLLNYLSQSAGLKEVIGLKEMEARNVKKEATGAVISETKQQMSAVKHIEM